MGNHHKVLFAASLCIFWCFDFFSQVCHGQLLLPSEVDDNDDQEGSQLRPDIVHVQRPKNDEYLSDKDLEDWHRSFFPNTTLEGGKPRLIYSYRYAISGFAAWLTSEEVRAMESTEEFLGVHPFKTVQLLTTYTPKFLGLSQHEGFWVDSKMGKGIIIGVIDSGITPNHASFMDDGTMPSPPSKWKGRCDFHNKTFCNNKLIGATAYDGSPEDDATKKIHGTHVAGIAAGSFVKNASVFGLANGTASGIAPKAHLASYKACSMECSNYEGVESFNQAIKDGVDVITVSMGWMSLLLYDDDWAIAAFSAIKKNIFVCMCAGNSGPRQSSQENGAPWIMTVGASSHDRIERATVILENGLELQGESGYQPQTFNSTTLPVVFPGFEGQNGTQGCSMKSFTDIDIKGKIVVCSFREHDVLRMSINVRRNGGAAMIALNTLTKGSTTFSFDYDIPAVHLNYTEAIKFLNYFRSSNKTRATISFKGTEYGARPSPTIPYFSSRGPYKENGGILKPDIVAPGVNILSAWPIRPGPIFNGTPDGAPNISYFNFQSGTSMSTPHIAGVAALLKSTHKKWSPAAIKSAIMTTADRFDRDGNPILDDYGDREKPASLFAVGAGQVNPMAANDPGLIYDIKPKEYIKYLCGMNFTDKQVTKIARKEVRCSKTGSISVEQLNYPSISISTSLYTSKLITRTLTNVGDANEVYSIYVEEPKGICVIVYPSQIQFSKVNEEKKISIFVSIKDMNLRKEAVVEGQLMLESEKHFVRSPISVTIV
ncbi:Peptidase S8 subtilisin-related protein [Dioscorea alata]|uniref:Peptidase S8 subtilisin-related protein n=1 Tax=Dioscorea alata TaxID=55571 RepID=A0ACB7WRP1_DIOAL|nr:Peptidase S8 subtilisin-related protein [Dioscorea alata]